MSTEPLGQFMAAVLAGASGGISFNVDKPMRPDTGTWVLDVCGSVTQVAVEYNATRGFGVFDPAEDYEAGFGQKPDYVSASYQEAATQTLAWMSEA